MMMGWKVTIAAMLDPEEDSDAEAVEDNLVFRRHPGEQILDFWNIRHQKLITPLSVAAWFCSPEAEIQKDVLENGTGQDRQAIDGVIAKIFHPIRWEDLALKILQAFWKEFDDFQSKTGEIYNGLSDPILFWLLSWNMLFQSMYSKRGLRIGSGIVLTKGGPRAYETSAFEISWIALVGWDGLRASSEM
jgi:hypothetical protein